MPVGELQVSRQFLRHSARTAQVRDVTNEADIMLIAKTPDWNTRRQALREPGENIQAVRGFELKQIDSVLVRLYLLRTGMTLTVVAFTRVLSASRAVVIGALLMYSRMPLDTGLGFDFLHSPSAALASATCGPWIAITSSALASWRGRFSIAKDT